MSKEKIRLESLRDELSQAASAYYNGTQSNMTDHEYDEKLKELAALEEAAGVSKSNRFSTEVGADVKAGLPKVEHEYPAKSLDKTKNLDAFLKAFPNRSVLMWKMDGSTGQATYINGKLSLLATRGNGEVGQVITDKAPYIKHLPTEIPYTGKLVVRGELVMSYDEFSRINNGLNSDEQYANPRNLAAGTISSVNLDDIKDREINFVAFQMVYSDDMPSDFSGRLARLAELGFRPVEHIVCNDNDRLEANMKIWENAVSAYEFPVDGLVVADQNAEMADRLPGTGHHPNVACGYAFKWADDEKKTVIEDIEWSPSRTGLLNPVAIFNPKVKLEGTVVGRATLHNIDFIKKHNIRKGDEVSVFKANKIIPEVARNHSEHDAVTNDEFKDIACPVCKAKAIVVTNDKDESAVLKCPNAHCSAKAIGKFVHFCERDCMDIRGLSEKTIEKMVLNGIISEFADFYRFADDKTAKAEVASWDKMGEKAVENIAAAIKKSAKGVRFVPFFHALGIKNIGKGQAKMLNTKYETIHDLFEVVTKYDHQEWTKEKYDAIITEFETIDGFGEILAKSLESWLHKYIFIGKGEMHQDDMEIIHLLKYLEFDEPETIMEYDDWSIRSYNGTTYVRDKKNPENDGKPVKQAKRVHISQIDGDVVDFGGDYDGEELNEPFASSWVIADDNNHSEASSIAGKTFVVTGKVEQFANREEIHEFIEAHGGKTSGSVSKNTDYLINNDIESTSGKNKKAKSLGVPIISEYDLLNMTKHMAK